MLLPMWQNTRRDALNKGPDKGGFSLEDRSLSRPFPSWIPIPIPIPHSPRRICLSGSGFCLNYATANSASSSNMLHATCYMQQPAAIATPTCNLQHPTPKSSNSHVPNWFTDTILPAISPPFPLHFPQRIDL